MITARCFSPTMRLRVLSALLLVAPIVRGQCPPPSTPYAPANGAITSETHIDFTWSPAGPAVTGYDVYLSHNAGTAARVCFNSPSPNCSATLTPAHYEWFVRSYRDDCLIGTDSAHSTFDIVGCSTPVAPTTLNPDAGAVTAASGVVLSWSCGPAYTPHASLQQ